MVAEAARIAERAEARHRPPRRHEPLAGHEGDHAVPAFRVVVAFEENGAMPPCRWHSTQLASMQRRDVAVGDLVEPSAVRARLAPIVMKAPDRLGCVWLRLAAVGQRLDDGAQVMRGNPRAQLAHGGEAIVDAAPVDDPVAGRDHEGLRGHTGAETLGQIAGAVQNDGERDTEVVYEVLARLPRDGGVRQDSIERHAVRLRLAVERVEGGHIARGNGAGGIEEDRYRRLHRPRGNANPVMVAGDVGDTNADQVDRIARSGRRDSGHR